MTTASTTAATRRARRRRRWTTPLPHPRSSGSGARSYRYRQARAANTGTNWVDTAWTCVSAQTCQGSGAQDTGGSGGGESTLFAQPDYQAAGIGHEPFTTTTGKKGDFGTQPRSPGPRHRRGRRPGERLRGADQRPGRREADAPRRPVRSAVRSSSRSAEPACRRPPPQRCSPTCWPSTARPQASATFMTRSTRRTPAHQGVSVTSGPGATAARRTSTAGPAVAAITAAARPRAPVNAERGYDTVTGLGAPLWPALAPYLFTPGARARLATRGAAPSRARRHRVMVHGTPARAARRWQRTARSPATGRRRRSISANMRRPPAPPFTGDSRRDYVVRGDRDRCAARQHADATDPRPVRRHAVHAEGAAATSDATDSAGRTSRRRRVRVGHGDRGRQLRRCSPSPVPKHGKLAVFQEAADRAGYDCRARRPRHTDDPRSSVATTTAASRAPSSSRATGSAPESFSRRGRGRWATVGS